MNKQELEYHDSDTTLRGELVWDDTHDRKRPGVLVIHEGGGINHHPKERARQLAELGYVALAADMFGNGEYEGDPQRRGARMSQLRSDPAKLRGRARAGLDALAQHPAVDRARLAAIGFCFGGMVVLEMARAGFDLAGVVSFHGILSTELPARAGVVKTKVLVCHGAEDPFVKPEQVAAFIAEMREARVDWQLDMYADAAHGFTRRDAASLGIPGVAFEPRAERRSWAAMRLFFDEIFASS